MKGTDMLIAIGFGLTMFGFGYSLGEYRTDERWERVTGCRLKYHEIAATNWYEAVRLGEGAK